MPIKMFKNTGDSFVESSEEFGLNTDSTGWWWSISEGDFDNDGDTDYVLGNNGLNYKYKATTKDHDFLAVGWLGFAFLIVGRIQICCRRREFCRAGVDPLVDRSDIELQPPLAHGAFVNSKHLGHSSVGKTLTFH